MTTIRATLMKEVPAVSLAFFRFVFGLMLAGGMIRFLLKGWVEDLYIAPTYYFKFYGFEFVQVLPPWAMYASFIVLTVAALMVAFGYRYKLAITVFFFLFTYVEMIDKTTYLNHYYFVSLVTFLMIWLPMDARYSVDAKRCPARGRNTVPNWMLLALMLQIGFVYFFGGIAKLKADWLLDAQPLRIWLSANSSFPVLGPLLDQVWVAYALSWGAMIFDLTILFVLLAPKLRPYGYAVLLVFHFFTSQFFLIGMFPYIMSTATLVFFSARFHESVMRWVVARLAWMREVALPRAAIVRARRPVLAYGLTVFLGVQVLLPFRHLLYPNDVTWSEEAFRFSWNIMLIEKTGHVEFVVKNVATGATWREYPSEHLTRLQEKMMSTQPDMIVEFAQHLKEKFAQQGIKQVAIYADAHVALNGRPSRRFIDPTVDLTTVSDGFAPRSWVLPFDEAPKSLTERVVNL